MSEVLIGSGAAAGAGAVWWLWRVQHIRRVSRERLNAEIAGREKREYVVTLTPSLRRYHWVPGVIGCPVALFAALVLRWATVYGVSLGVIVGVIAWIVEQQIAARRALRLETQLANSIDLMVGALSAGAGTTEALDSAARESPRPMKDEIEE